MTTDAGVPGDAPFLGRPVIYRDVDGAFVPALVTNVYADGWTVDLVGFQIEDGVGVLAGDQLVRYGGNKEFGKIDNSSWVTPGEYEGWKIFQEERSVTNGEG